MPGPAPTSAASLHPSPSLSRRTRRSVGPDRRGDGDGRAQGGAGGAPGSTRGGGVSRTAAKALRGGIGVAVRGDCDRLLPRRDVHFALEMCVLPSRTTVGTALSSAKCTSRRQRRPPRSPPSRPVRGPPVGPRRRRLSESVAKAPIAPERRKRNVDIPRFFSPSILARSAFAADLDTPPPRVDPGSPHAPLRARPCHHDDPRLRARRAFSAARRRSGSGR